MSASTKLPGASTDRSPLSLERCVYARSHCVPNPLLPIRLLTGSSSLSLLLYNLLQLEHALLNLCRKHLGLPGSHAHLCLEAFLHPSINPPAPLQCCFPFQALYCSPDICYDQRLHVYPPIYPFLLSRCWAPQEMAPCSWNTSLRLLGPPSILVG